MVLGLAMPVICHPPRVSQWADTHKISCGCTARAINSLPMACQLRRQALSSIAFMGLPWPTNSTGMRGEGFRDCSKGKPAALDQEAMKAPEEAASPARAAKEVLRCMR